jgi:hypothetical protein
VAHLLLHFGGVALRAGDAAGLVFRQTHDVHKLCPTLDAHIFIGGHGIPPDPQDNNRDIAGALTTAIKKTILGILLPEFNPEKVLLFVANLPY